MNLPITACNYKNELGNIRRTAHEDGFPNRTINKLLYEHKSKQNTITVQDTQNKENKQ